MTRERGRRAALPPPERVARELRARLNVTALLALALPALTVGALWLVRPADIHESARPPQASELNLAILTCPSSIGDSREVKVASATGTAGEVELIPAGDAAEDSSVSTVQVPADGVAADRIGGRPLTVRATDAMAPGLLAARQDVGPAAVSCTVPESDQWFTGLGAAARHSSVLELVNPDPGPAVADITVVGPRGVVDAPSMRGITVPGGRRLRLVLAREIPLRGELAAHVVVSRGRLGVHVEDTFDELGRGEAGVDWLASHQPGEDLLLLGLPAGAGTRALVVANPGDDEARVVVRVVTRDSAFRPQGLDDVRVPPGTVIRVPLSSIIGKAVKDGAVGVSLESTHPVSATLRSFVNGDVSHAVPLTSFSEMTEAVLPEGRASVLLAADSVGSAEVVARLPDGTSKTQQVDLAPGRTVSVRLPKGAELVQVTPSRTAVRGSVVTVDGGASVLALAELVRTGLVPDLRPALP